MAGEDDGGPGRDGTQAAHDLTLDELRERLASALADAAVFDGWSRAAVRMAAESEGVDPDVADLAYDGDRMLMIESWIASVDAAMVAAHPPGSFDGVKVRERIRRLVLFRLEQVRMREEAVRRAMAIMAMPQNAARALRTAWHSADLMWRLAGDTATDWNHYSKRAILAGLYSAVLTVFINDRSEQNRDTHAFLDRRLDGVMRFERLKASFTRPRRERFSLLRLAGRLRYPER
ncbi:COQ9 family protein [Erythrobacteraceae bacterium CFH 75059]|uniref:COQ9 family protein n=1 Tax=Qipengyuania thermophila TaxID=2509361 RepID=UPI0010221EA5|nr:COQ9 family protein [Qipengyuania thermophila]TCD04081.1 COQ9 family protein [Erythrobacteraceae bacterium CFH 75059]